MPRSLTEDTFVASGALNIFLRSWQPDRGKSDGERFHVEDVADYVTDLAGAVKERRLG